MKNSWLTWILILGIIAVVLISFNHQSGQEAISLSEIFPEDQSQDNVEYEIVDKETSAGSQAAVLPQKASQQDLAKLYRPPPSTSEVSKTIDPATASLEDAAFTI